MIFFAYQSKLCVATLVFYTCVYLPFQQTKRTLLSVLGFVLCLYHHPLECSNHPTTDAGLRETCSIDLSMRRYGDLKASASTDVDQEEEEACSVCLVEFESEDMVSQLSKCGHIFHMACIDKWVERNQFTCPLCRSLFLNKHVHGSHATCNGIIHCISS